MFRGTSNVENKGPSLVSKKLSKLRSEDNGCFGVSGWKKNNILIEKVAVNSAGFEGGLVITVAFM